MSVLTGTTGNDNYLGAIGVQDVAIINSTQAKTSFSLVNRLWKVTSTAGQDNLTSIEQVQLDDVLLQLKPGGETPVNTVTTSDQVDPQVAFLKSGFHVVTWESNGQDGSAAGIYSQLYNAVGDKVGGEVLVNTVTANGQIDPTVAALSDGSYVIAWASALADASGSAVAFQRFSAAGAKVGAETLANTFTTGDQLAPAITSLTTGGFVIAWQSQLQDGSQLGIYAQRFSAAGAKVGTEIAVNTFTTGSQDSPAIASLASGAFVIVWQSASQDGSSLGVYAQRYNSSGLAVGGETLVNTVTSNTQSAPAVTSLTGGGYVVTWQSLNVATSSFDIFAQRFDVNGVKLGGEIMVNTVGAESQDMPAVAALSGGGFVVTWQSQLQDGSGYGLYSQRFDANGDKVGIELAVNNYTNSDQMLASVSSLPTGGHIVTWQSQVQDGNGYGVFSQRFAADGNPELPTIIGDDRPNILTLTGTGPAALDGQDGNDTLTAGAGNDLLDGGAGNDSLKGGAGNDIYVADAGDRIIELADGGIDTVQVAGSYTLTSANVENVVVTGIAAANLIGSNLANWLVGNAAENLLNGGGGADRMEGRNGNDTYIVDDLNDLVVEEAGSGSDAVVSQIDYILGLNLESLRLVGTNGINGTGNALDNQLTGNAAANVLAGEGGADVLIGENGNDTYVVDALDQIIEELGEGVDSVNATASWALADNLENLTLLEGGNYNGTGNGLANVLYGNTGNNVLDGREGADFMDGGAGNDTYFVDNAGDAASETAVSTDLVKSTVSHGLGAGIENLTLLGIDAVNGTGNALNNVIRGNSGANILSGGIGTDTLYGGYGDDRLISSDGLDRLLGGIGNDVYEVSGETDDLVELSGQGTDTVMALVNRSYTLGLNLENLVLQGSNVDGHGNSDANQITGTVGNNLLDGGAGNDRLIGLAGNDTYVVDSTADLIVEAAAEGVDQVLSSVTHTLALHVENLTLTGAKVLNGTGNVLQNRLTGNDAANILNGKDGNDILVGAGGNDQLLGDLGNDSLSGGLGNDLLDGGVGIDLATYYLVTAGVSVNLELATAQNTIGAGTDTLVAVENLDGSNNGGDTLRGNALGNRINGFGGADTLTGGAGNDFLYGGEGDDLVNADGDNDWIDGGNGSDRISFSAIAANINVDLNLASWQITGAGSDVIRNIEIVEGSQTGSDRLTGDSENNSLLGLGGNDVLAGGDGDDVLDGGAGIDTADYSLAWDAVIVDLSLASAVNDGSGFADSLLGIENLTGSEFDDVLIGNASANVFTGGIGRDILEGNGGNDVFAFRSLAEMGTTSTTWDVISDFTVGDKIDLSLIDANSAVVGLQDFTAIIASNQAFTAAGQLKLLNGVLYGNTDADTAFEFSIQLDSVTAITLSDFII